MPVACGKVVGPACRGVPEANAERQKVAMPARLPRAHPCRLGARQRSLGDHSMAVGVRHRWHGELARIFHAYATVWPYRGEFDDPKGESGYCEPIA